MLAIVENKKMIVLFISVLLLTSCGGTNKNTINNSTADGGLTNAAIGTGISPAQPNDNFESGYSTKDNWSKINDFTNFIGMTIFEIAEYHNGLNYTWYGGKHQSVRTLDEAFLYFTGLVWENSTCSAVLVDGGSIFPEPERDLTSDELKRFYGSNHINTKMKNGVDKFEYVFKDYSVIFITNTDGLLKSDEKCVMIISNCEDITPYEIIEQNKMEYEINSKSNRDSAKWASVNEAIGFLGMGKDEIMHNAGSWTLMQSKSDVLYNNKKNTRLYLDGGDKVIAVELSINLLLSDIKDEFVSMSNLADYFDLPFSWGIYEGSGYQFYFEDVIMTIEADENGNIDMKNNLVISKFVSTGGVN